MNVGTFSPMAYCNAFAYTATFDASSLGLTMSNHPTSYLKSAPKYEIRH